MAACKKPICPQCRTEGNIVLLDTNTERTMYKCKKCKPFHIFSILSDSGEELCPVPEEEKTAEPSEKKPRKRWIWF